MLNIKWFIRKICLKIELLSRSLIVPNDWVTRVPKLEKKQEIIDYQIEVNNLLNQYPEEPIFLKAKEIIEKKLEKIELMESLSNRLNLSVSERYYWNIIELKKDNLIYGIHILTNKRIYEERLNELFELIKNGQFEIKFMSLRESSKEAEFNIPFKMPEYNSISLIIGKKDYDKSFFEKAYKNSFETFNYKEF